MRISDWSSDVCSSDLDRIDRADGKTGGAGRDVLHGFDIIVPKLFGAEGGDRDRDVLEPLFLTLCSDDDVAARAVVGLLRRDRRGHRGGGDAGQQEDRLLLSGISRSEEHTSELQSLMRISY